MEKFARNLDWNLLYTFIVIAQENSLTAAADRLLITQPAVSLALKRLEETVGTRLIERGAGRFKPTLAGESLYQEANKIYASIARLPVLLESAPKSVSGKIKIATISQVVSSRYDELLQSFFEEYPKIELEITVSAAADIIQEVELGHATIGICGGSIPDHLQRTVLLSEEYGIFCGSRHPLFTRSTKPSLRDLRGLPFVNFLADELGGAHMNEVTAYRAKSSIGQWMRGRSSNVNEVIRMLEIGLGVGFLPLHLAHPYEQSGKLRRLPPYREVPKTDIFVIHNANLSYAPAEKIFVGALENQIGKLTLG